MRGLRFVHASLRMVSRGRWVAAGCAVGAAGTVWLAAAALECAPSLAPELAPQVVDSPVAPPTNKDVDVVLQAEPSDGS